MMGGNQSVTLVQAYHMCACGSEVLAGLDADGKDVVMSHMMIHRHCIGLEYVDEDAFEVPAHLEDSEFSSDD